MQLNRANRPWKGKCRVWSGGKGDRSTKYEEERGQGLRGITLHRGHLPYQGVRMGLKSRSKGKRAERELVRLARQHGLDARRSWELAQSPDPSERRCDVTIAGRSAQVKIAGNGFRTLYEALEGVDLAFLRADRRSWIAVLPADEYLRLLRDCNAKRR